MRRYQLLLVLGLALALALGLTACGGDDGLPGKTTLATMLPEEPSASDSLPEAESSASAAPEEPGVDDGASEAETPESMPPEELSIGIGLPGKDTLASLLPKKLYKYTLEFLEYTAELAGLKIVDQQLAGETCTTECEATFMDENIVRLEYLRLTTTFSAEKGWKLESWEAVREPEYALAEPFDEGVFLSELIYNGYHKETLTRLKTHDSKGNVLEKMKDYGLTDNTSTKYSAAYEVNDDLGNMTITGVLTAEVDLTLAKGSGFPREFYWFPIVYDTYCNYDWTISGNWHCDFTDGGVDHTLDAVLELTEEPWALDAEHRYGVKGRFVLDGTDERLFTNEGHGYSSFYQADYYPRMFLVMELYSYGDDGTCYRIAFYPTYAELWVYKNYQKDAGFMVNKDLEGSYKFKKV